MRQSVFSQRNMNYWLIKSDPEEFGWKELLRDGKTAWTGVRSAAAALNLKKMKAGDIALFYESQGPKEIVGLSTIKKAAYPDPTNTDTKRDWVAVDVVPGKPFKRPVTLAEIKADPFFIDFLLVRQSRLSVMPVTVKQYEKIVSKGQK